MSGSFLERSRIEKVEEGLFHWEVPDGWQQGRGAFGGLVLGTLLRAMEASEPDKTRAVRAITGDLCGPVVPGRAELRIRVLRRGANQTNLQADLSQSGVVLATATSILSEPRPISPVLISGHPPERPAWSELPLLPMGAPAGPAFAANYEYRNVGPLPFSSGREPVVAGFIRERERLEALDSAALVGRLDAWWPALFSVESAPRPMATISFTAQILCDPATLPPDEPFFHRAKVAALYEGFFLELRELWCGDRAIATNQQTFVVIK